MSNTDRELLELAAKAFGLAYHSYVHCPFQGIGINIGDTKTPIWNPLTNDGDALRLVVKLKIELLHNNQNETPLWVSAVVKNTTINAAENFLLEDMRMAAGRLAIVRAAAEVGSQMGAREGTP